MNNELLLVMEKCGHFLYHRRGGKRGQGRILKLLLMKGSMTQKELQNYLDIKAGSMSEIIMKLENSGLITRKKDETDKRKYKIILTQQGEKVAHQNADINQQQQSKLFAALSEQEQQELLRLLTKLLNNWKEHFDKTFFEYRKGMCKEEHMD